MKSRIINPVPETIILYKTEEFSNGIKRIADKLGISIIEAAADQAGETVGFLAGFNGFSSNGSKEECDNSCMIFSAISGKKLDTVLAEMRKAEISVPYKAVITASNQSWSLKKLAAELVKEREKLGG